MVLNTRFFFVGRTAVHGAEMAGADVFHGLKEGSEVVVHYAVKGSEETALEIDHIGEGGLKSTKETITRFDRKAKTFTIKAEDGTEHEFRLAERAAEDAGNDISEDAQKSAKVTVYYADKPVTKWRAFSARIFSPKAPANRGGLTLTFKWPASAAQFAPNSSHKGCICSSYGCSTATPITPPD